MKSLAKSLQTLAGQFYRLQRIPNSNEPCQIINEFSSIMGEVMSFIRDWLEDWMRT